MFKVIFSNNLEDFSLLDYSFILWLQYSLPYFQELSTEYGLTVTDTKQYSDYIPEYIDQMDTIVAETYERTRGELHLRILLISLSK